MSHHALGGASLAVSLAFHAWLLLSSDGRAPLQRARPPAFVQLTLEHAAPAEPKPPPEPAEPEPEPKPAPKPVAPKVTARAALAEPPPQAPAPPTTEAPPPELTGTTLTSEQSDGWTAPEGSGSARDGLVRTGALSSLAARAPAEPQGVTEPARPRALPEALPLAQLSRKPAPPSLAAALERNYPTEARRLGQSGDASVRARIEATGNVQLAKLVTETARGFGDACRRTLLASKWSAPLDRSGKPVATWITYRCRFRVDH